MQVFFFFFFFFFFVVVVVVVVVVVEEGSYVDGVRKVSVRIGKKRKVKVFYVWEAEKSESYLCVRSY